MPFVVRLTSLLTCGLFSVLCCVRKILDADANPRPYLETYEGKHAKTMNDINLRKLQKVALLTPGPSENDGKRKAGDNNDDEKEQEKEQEDESGGAGEDDDEERLLCSTYNPPPTSK